MIQACGPILYIIVLNSIQAHGQSREYLHPLDPLRPTEIQTCSNIVRTTQPTSTGWNFIWITLAEPEKAILFPILRSREQWSRIPRKCFVVVIERNYGRVFEGTVNLHKESLETWHALPTGTQPMYAPQELAAGEQIFRNDSRVKERCARLGYNDMELVAGEPWPIGYIDDRPEWRGRRLLQVFPYGLSSRDDNPLAHPFDFIGIVDVIQERVIAIEDLPVHHQFSVRNRNVGVSVPQKDANYDQILLRGNFSHSRFRTPNPPSSQTKPILPNNHPHVNQPPKYSFKPTPQHVPYTPSYHVPLYRYKRYETKPQPSQVRLNGKELQWENFQMRIGFNGREGMVLYDIGFNDGANLRPLIYRVSMVEMLVPYADPRPPYHRKAVFDSGEYGMGVWANALQAGVDCPSTAVFIQSTVNTLEGTPQSKPNAICVFEEDPGLLFKHTHVRNGRITHARGRRLVISSISTVGNYDYAFYWYFGLDGSIQYTVKATGLLDTELLAIGEDTYGYGIQISPQLNTQFHQHLFAVRLDPMFDGHLNSVAMVDVEQDSAETGNAKNPYGHAFTTRENILETVAEGCTRINPIKARTWHIFNPSVVHPNVKEFSGYRFLPMNTAPLLMRRDSPLYPKSAFTNYDVWVTPYNEKEIYPGGFYLNNRGLPEVVKRNPQAPIKNRDIVFWHIFGITHIPRSEDFPIMPMEETGFSIRPHNFFLQNPSLNYGITQIPSPRNLG